jgi:hypothetical protein
LPIILTEVIPSPLAIVPPEVIAWLLVPVTRATFDLARQVQPPILTHRASTSYLHTFHLLGSHSIRFSSLRTYCGLALALAALLVAAGALLPSLAALMHQALYLELLLQLCKLVLGRRLVPAEALIGGLVLDYFLVVALVPIGGLLLLSPQARDLEVLLVVVLGESRQFLQGVRVA